MAKTSFSSHSEHQTQLWVGVFGHGRTMHDNLGGGKVAHILLWENKILSAAILIVLTSMVHPKTDSAAHTDTYGIACAASYGGGCGG